MTRIFGILVLFLVLSVPSPGRTSDLIRLTDRDDLLGWEGVGRIDLGTDSYCTGTLISDTLVLTAAHCMFDNRGAPQLPERVTFRAGLRDGSAIAARNISRYVVADGYQPKDGMSAQNIRNDMALLELSTPIPTAIAAPFALHPNPTSKDEISVVSYGMTRDDALSWERDCDILQRGSGLIAFNCNVTFGSSGAPVFAEGIYRKQIVSLVVGGHKTKDGGTVAYGMELPNTVDALKRKLRAAASRAPSTSSSTFRKVEVSRVGNATGAKFARPN